MKSDSTGHTWQEILSQSYCSVEDIASDLGLDAAQQQAVRSIIEKYPMCVNPYYYSLIDKTDPADPVRKMCIPDPVEFSAGGEEDTSGEASNTVVQGMQHKYRQTALILSTNKCAMYCRHCFRKRMVGIHSEETARHLDEMAEYIRQHPEINNVLISGGDAFMNSNDVIRKYLACFTVLPSLGFIRFGTRTPVVLPQRITEDPELIAMLIEYSCRKQLYIVTQFNHPHELTEEAEKAVHMLHSAGCIVRNQTVLLKGVNSDPAVLGTLLNRLSDAGVVPYYVFQCRPVTGVKNQFQVPLLQGIELFNKARTLMNGIAKSARYIMSHPTGKIEILGRCGNSDMLFRYHQSKYSEDASRIFTVSMEENQCWLDKIPDSTTQQ